MGLIIEFRGKHQATLRSPELSNVTWRAPEYRGSRMLLRFSLNQIFSLCLRKGAPSYEARCAARSTDNGRLRICSVRDFDSRAITRDPLENFLAIVPRSDSERSANCACGNDLLS